MLTMATLEKATVHQYRAAFAEALEAGAPVVGLNGATYTLERWASDFYRVTRTAPGAPLHRQVSLVELSPQGHLAPPLDEKPMGRELAIGWALADSLLGEVANPSTGARPQIDQP